MQLRQALCFSAPTLPSDPTQLGTGIIRAPVYVGTNTSVFTVATYDTTQLQLKVSGSSVYYSFLLLLPSFRLAGERGEERSNDRVSQLCDIITLSNSAHTAKNKIYPMLQHLQKFNVKYAWFHILGTCTHPAIRYGYFLLKN